MAAFVESNPYAHLGGNWKKNLSFVQEKSGLRGVDFCSMESHVSGTTSAGAVQPLKRPGQWGALLR